MNGTVPTTMMEPIKNSQHDQEKNWNSRIDWNGK
jgi:hypothetical protein